MFNEKVLDRLKKAILFITLTAFFFTIMAKLDFLVHSSLYNYGLVFSYEWANTYWLIYGIAFFAFSLMACFVYWASSPKTFHTKKVAACILLTINLLAIGGLQDLIYFAIWDGGLPTAGVEWWWSYWTYVFGTWNTPMQITLTSIMIAISIVAWSFTLRAKPYRNQPIDNPIAKHSITNL